MKEIKSLEWPLLSASLDEKGYAIIPAVLSDKECAELRKLYHAADIYRNVISMERYRFGKGEYKYFSYPLPPIVQQLRHEFYNPLSIVANEWMDRLGIEMRYPAVHKDLIQRCHEKKQVRPTPLILRYEQGGYNTLHQDLYGEIYFPFQVVLVLSQSGKDFEGGEFVLTEQVPRAQSRARVLKLDQGDAMIFTTNFRPVKGTKGYYRTTMKHGISELTSGTRYALGIIFHDAT
jgi:hypothetical protein